MSVEPKQDSVPIQPMVFRIRIKGHWNDLWTDWFEGMTISLEENGDTLLTGPVVDQATLYGLLRRVRDVGMPLVSVNRVESGEQDRPTAHFENRQHQ